MSTPQNHIQQNLNTLNEESRRAFLKKSTGVMGVTGFSSILSSCSLKSADDFSKGKISAEKPAKLFSETDMTVLYAIVDTILPRTDTPSASEVNCHNFVHHQLQHCHSEVEQQLCVDIVKKIDQVSIQQSGKNFALLSGQEQQMLLNQLEQGSKFTDNDRGHFSFLKALVAFGYFTSEVGATQALNYQAVPGGFKGSIPSDKNTKSWGSIDYY